MVKAESNQIRILCSRLEAQNLNFKLTAAPTYLPVYTSSQVCLGNHTSKIKEENMKSVCSDCNSTQVNGLESETGESHCEKEKWHDMLPEEEDMICRLHRLLGDRWELISGRLPNRKAEEVERYWRMKESKKSENKVLRPVCVRAKPSLKLAMMS